MSQKAIEPGCPDEAAGEFRPGQVLAEEVEQRLALRLGHVLEAGGVGDVDEERLAAGLRMGADDRVLGLVGGAGVGSGTVLQPVLAGLRHVRLGRGRDPSRPSSIRRMPGDRVSSARYMLAKSVSPP